MAFVMGATMAVIMLSFMRHMLNNRRMNIGIVLASVIVFSVALWLVRSQATVEDVSYMKAMIPHHSIAILTSERARISDPRVRKLADQIIETQGNFRDEGVNQRSREPSILKRVCIFQLQNSVQAVN
jgi:Domain of unknown function (DUF305)